MNATALIAEDEPLLAQALQAELAQVWPQLQVLACVGDGASAVRQALALQPQVLFFDIRMPVLSGLEAAAELADLWPPERPFPALVFVTAYDQYALAAFDAQAVDYLLKPVQRARLQSTVERLQRALQRPAPALDDTLAQLRALLAPASPAAPAPLRVSQASSGNNIHLLPLEQVIYFEAADKYLRVVSAEREYLIRTPIKELLPQLDPQSFWQIHRGTVVRVDQIASVQRDGTGRIRLLLRQRPETLAVSRLYAYLFRPM